MLSERTTGSVLEHKIPNSKTKRAQAFVASNCVSSWNVLYLTFIELQRPVAATLEAKLKALAGARMAIIRPLHYRRSFWNKL
jgi:hypothetical protein